MAETPRNDRVLFSFVGVAALVVALLTVSPVAAARAFAPSDVPSAERLAEQPFLVRYEPGPSLHSAEGDQRWGERGPQPGETLQEAYERLSLTPGIGAVDFNYRYEQHGIPNDPLFAWQWHMWTINTPDAWDLSDGTGVVVAVLDSGVATGGRDLTCRTFVDPYNAITAVAGLAAAGDENGHGTHVTGTVAQCTNNGVGVAGVAHGASIMPVKVTDRDGHGTSLSVVMGMDWAIAHGADVINLSLGVECFATWPACSDPAVDSLIDVADKDGIVVVASSGNEGSLFVGSPANHPLTIAVGATEIHDAKVGYSNSGSALDVMAPGGTVDDGVIQETFSLSGAWGYGEWFGTSMAAPHVSGTVALMKSVNPVASPAQIRDALETTAVDLGTPGWDALTGHGLIDAAAAVAAIRLYADPGDPCPDGSICDGAYSVDTGGRWSLRASLPGPPANVFYYGNPGDVAFSGDWDCDGTASPGLYRQSDGFVYLRNSSTQGVADREFFFGDPGDVPIAGDFNGDGCDTVSVYRATEGRVYIVNRLGEDGGGLGPADFDYYFGNPGDKPFTGDFDADGVDTVGLHRESTGLAYFRNSHTPGVADASFIFGDPGDQILAGDWDGSGIDTVAVYRPATGTLYVKLANTQGVADHQYPFGFGVQVVGAGASP